MHNSNLVTLIVFTCEGREHLLSQSFRSFKESCSYNFAKTILAIDGTIDQTLIKQINPDVVVQNSNRKGYIYNILNAIHLIDTPYFFWLEDDWRFNSKIDLIEFLGIFECNTNITEIILSKYEILPEDLNEFNSNFIISPFGFSANPCLCKTSYVRAAFKALQDLPKNDETRLQGFETFLTSFFQSQGFICIIKRPKGIACIEHTGDLESTPREYHMVNSLDLKTSDIGKSYISGLGSDNQISLLNRISMLLKMVYSFLVVTISMFFSRKYYDLAFRIFVITHSNLKKNDKKNKKFLGFSFSKFL